MDLYETWEYLSFLFYIALVVYVILPFIVGFVVIVTTLFLSLKFPNIDQPTYHPISNLVSDRTSVGGKSHEGSAFLLRLQRKQRNEYYFQSVLTLYNNDSLLPIWILKDILYDFFKPYTTVTFERILVVIPSMQTLYSSLLRKTGLPRCHEKFSAASHFEDTVSNIVTVPSMHSCNGSIDQAKTVSTTKLTYMDLSLRKYWNSPQNFYKEKRPIHFKFWRDLDA